MNLVSVIIPTYNRAALLEKALQSVVAQTHRPIECIVIDDGSQDDTIARVEKMASTFDEGISLKIIQQPNSGAQVARNAGTAASTGEFIQYLDSDDLLYPGKISNQVQYLRVHRECDAVFGDWEVGEPHAKKKVVAYMNENLVEQMLAERCIHTLAVLMRKSLVKKIGDWDVSIKRNQEIDFHLRGVLTGGNFRYNSFCCGLWRMHGGERIVSKATLFSAIEFYRKWEDILLNKGFFSKNIQQGIVNNYLWFLGEYPDSSYKELTAMLKEMHRLNPTISIFASTKFSFLKNSFGLTIAIKLWIYRYKQQLGKRLNTPLSIDI